MNHAILAVIGSSMLALGGAAGAFPIKYAFEGTATFSGVPVIELGSSISGSFIMDSTTPDSAPGIPSSGVYIATPVFTATVNSAISGTVTFGGGVFDPSGDGARVRNNDATAIDRFSADGGLTGPVISPGWIPSSWRFEITDPDELALSSDALPLTLNLADFGPGELDRTVTLSLTPASGFPFTQQVRFELKALQVETLPEPASLALVCVALAGLVFARRRKPH